MGTTKSTRRKFLSGSVAAPLILTVQSASATTTPISSSMCRTNDLNAGIPPAGYLPLPTQDPLNPDPDAWLRANIQIVTLSQGSAPATAVPGYFVKSTNGSAYYSVNVNDPTALPQLTNLIPGGYAETPYSTRRGLVLVDSGGNTVGFQWENAAGQKITKSCWTSFR